ncbi:unnamed protein product, partial [Ectocarpus sp. 12 AP-2014]
MFDPCLPLPRKMTGDFQKTHPFPELFIIFTIPHFILVSLLWPACTLYYSTSIPPSAPFSSVPTERSSAASKPAFPPRQVIDVSTVVDGKMVGSSSSHSGLRVGGTGRDLARAG